MLMKYLPKLVKSAPGSEMADREKVLKERKKAKFLWTHFGKGVLSAIDEGIDPEFAVLYYDDYTAEARRVLNLCKELATYDKVDSLEETENVVFIENIQKQTENIISRYISYRNFFKENAVESRENNEKDDDDIEELETVKKDEYAPKLEIEVKGNEGKDENYKENAGNVQNEVKEETENMNENINLEYKDIQSENELCDVALACDDKEELTQNLVISNEINEESSCQNEECLVEMKKHISNCGIYSDTNLIDEKQRKQSIKKLHAATNHENFVCEQCGKCFKSRPSMNSHVKTIHEKCPPQGCNKETFSEDFKEFQEKKPLDLQVKKVPYPQVKKVQDVQEKKPPDLQVKRARDLQVKKIQDMPVKKAPDLQVKKVPDVPVKKVPPDLLEDPEDCEKCFKSECEQCKKRFRRGQSWKSHVESAHDQPGASLLSRSLIISGGVLDYGHLSVRIVVKKLANKLCAFVTMAGSHVANTFKQLNAIENCLQSSVKHQLLVPEVVYKKKR